MDHYGFSVEVAYEGTGHTIQTMNWLEKNIGYWGTNWIRTGGESSTLKTTHIYYFKEEKDAIMFALRWK